MQDHPKGLAAGDGELIDSFRLWWRVSRQSDRTITNYVHSLRRVSLWLAVQPNPASLTTADQKAIMIFLAERYDQVSPRTGQTDYKALRAFYKWAAQQEGMANPILSLRGPKVNAEEYEKVATTATEDDYNALVKTCRIGADTGRVARAINVRDHAILTCMWWLGVRPVELSYMRVEDVDLREGRIGVRKSKNGKPRMLPIAHQTFLLSLDRWLRTRKALNVDSGETALFIGLGRNGKKGRGGMLTGGITQMYRRRRATAGVTHEAYAFRRGRVIQYITAGMTDAEINRMMGWTEGSRMKARYARGEIDRVVGDRVTELFSEGTVTRLKDLA